MADILRSNHHHKAFHVLGLFSLLLLLQKGGAYEFKVGGSVGTWTVPTDTNALSYNQWAENNRFQIGDTLLFVYAADKDSVLRVTKEDYTKCNTATPLEKFHDGHTVFKFSQSGAHYFTSGVKDNCLKNEKLVVVVLAERSNGSTEGVPSPAPAGEESPSPPSGSVEIIPSPSPDEVTPAPSGASSIVLSFIGSIGAFIGSSLVSASFLI
uniref:Putative early nodulin-like protein 1 n=1 Tax=Davidia involucrata TaxID=16924 RepID=A0A5B7CFN0_DAVIN